MAWPITGTRASTVSAEGKLTVEALHSRLATYTFRAPDQLRILQGPEPALVGDLLVMGTNIVTLSAPTQ